MFEQTAGVCTLFRSPIISHVATGGRDGRDRERGAQHEDIQVYVLALCSPLPALTLPPHRLTGQPANHHHDPRVLYPTHTFSPATHTSPGATTGCRHPVYAAAPALYSPLPCSGPLPHIPSPSPRIPASHGTCHPPSTCCPPPLGADLPPHLSVPPPSTCRRRRRLLPPPTFLPPPTRPRPYRRIPA